VTGHEEVAAKANDTVMTNHNVYRNGSVWACRFCPKTWPFPAPLPDDPGPCVPRRWGDGAEGS